MIRVAKRRKPRKKVPPTGGPMQDSRTKRLGESVRKHIQEALDEIDEALDVFDEEG